MWIEKERDFLNFPASFSIQNLIEKNLVKTHLGVKTKKSHEKMQKSKETQNK